MENKTIKIDGKDIKIKASANIPRMYREKFGRDIFADIYALQDSYNALAQNAKAVKGQKGKPAKAELSIEDLQKFDIIVFENIMYCMAKNADDSVPDSISEWLAGFSIFAVYYALPQVVPILECWVDNNKTHSVAKKNEGQ